MLRGLMRACVDDERTLKHESGLVDDGRAGTLTRLARERMRFVDELEALAQVGGRRPKGTWAAMVREAARNVWVVAVGKNNGDAIAVCRHSRGRTEALYDEALRLTWPEATSSLLADHRRRLHDETQELNQIQF